MITQTWAILVDVYRELNTKMLFWIAVLLTIGVMLLFAVLGANDRTITVLWYEPFGPIPAARFFYKYLFDYVVVGLWFTWAATILALISTAAIFPDFMSAGSIDLYLAKPISRVRLFFTKYAAALLFVALQIAIFSLGSFLILGIRGGTWEPGIFLAIPIVLLFFSYLFAFCTFFGVLTRSTIAALLLTLLCWFGLWVVDRVDTTIGQVAAQIEVRHEAYTAQVKQAQARLDALQTNPPATADADAQAQVEKAQTQLDEMKSERDASVVGPGLHRAKQVLFGIQSVLPKTRETISLLDRVLFSDAVLKQAAASDEETASNGPIASAPPADATTENFRESARASRDPATRIEFGMATDPARKRSVWWIVLTSLPSEILLLALAAWRFQARDF